MFDSTRALLRPLLAALLATGLVSCGGGGSQSGDAGARELVVATQNLYYGAEFAPVIGAVASGDPDAIVGAATQAWADVRAADFATRAEGIADQIAATTPDFVGLQEAALFRSQVPSDTFTADPTPAATVELDYVQMLLDALARRGLAYVVAVSAESLDVELPALADDGATLMDLRITDRDVLLARAGPAADDVSWSNPRSGTYAAGIPLDGGIFLPNGWVSVDAEVDGRTVRVVSTHLASDVEDVQRLQAEELLGAPVAGATEVVLLGDFNSDALRGTGPDATATYDDVLAAGFSDAWALAEPGDLGPTWGRPGPLTDPDPALSERIDFVFLRGAIDADDAQRLGEDAADRRGGLWPSDHAGVAATLRVR